MQIECKLVVDFQCFCVDNFRNDKYPQKQENLKISLFSVVDLCNILLKWCLGEYLTLY